VLKGSGRAVDEAHSSDLSAPRPLPDHERHHFQPIEDKNARRPASEASSFLRQAPHRSPTPDGLQTRPARLTAQPRSRATFGPCRPGFRREVMRRVATTLSLGLMPPNHILQVHDSGCGHLGPVAGGLSHRVFAGASRGFPFGLRGRAAWSSRLWLLGSIGPERTLASGWFSP